jgi:predicted metal-dependent phosphoesterase TrpH
MLKIDLHTHSAGSSDGGITEKQYEQALNEGLLDIIAITDHNRIDIAKKIQRKYGQKIIVGEEIMTTEGELIGLFLKEHVEPGLTPIETVQRIKVQGGIVYLPHPFETVRKGLSESALNRVAGHIDIVELHNGRALVQNRSQKAAAWATKHQKVGAASSDAHGKAGIGQTYTLIKRLPTAVTLTSELSNASFMLKRPPLHTLLYPKLNRLKKRIIK